MITKHEIKLVEIFRIVLELDINTDILTVRRITEPRWDSLAHVSMVAAIESEFCLHFEIVDMDRMSSFAATKLMLEEKGL